MSSPLLQAPAAVAEQLATSISSSAQALPAQIQVALSCEKQQCWPAVGAGHSATGLPIVTLASVDTDPHWQYEDAESERQL
jgi:hypothetical protein